MSDFNNNKNVKDKKKEGNTKSEIKKQESEPDSGMTEML